MQPKLQQSVRVSKSTLLSTSKNSILQIKPVYNQNRGRRTASTSQSQNNGNRNSSHIRYPSDDDEAQEEEKDQKFADFKIRIGIW